MCHGITHFATAFLLIGFDSSQFSSSSEFVYNYISKLHNLPLDFIRDLDNLVYKIESREVSNYREIDYSKILDEVKPFLVKYL